MPHFILGTRSAGLGVPETMQSWAPLAPSCQDRFACVGLGSDTIVPICCGVLPRPHLAQPELLIFHVYVISPWDIVHLILSSHDGWH